MGWVDRVVFGGLCAGVGFGAAKFSEIADKRNSVAEAVDANKICELIIDSKATGEFPETESLAKADGRLGEIMARMQAIMNGGEEQGVYEFYAMAERYKNAISLQYSSCYPLFARYQHEIEDFFQKAKDFSDKNLADKYDDNYQVRQMMVKNLAKIQELRKKPKVMNDHDMKMAKATLSYLSDPEKYNAILYGAGEKPFSR